MTATSGQSLWWENKKNRGIVSRQVRHDKHSSMLKGCWPCPQKRPLITCSIPSPVTVAFPYQPHFQREVKLSTNTQNLLNGISKVLCFYKADHCKWKRHGLNEDLQISYSITDLEANFFDILPKGRLQNCFHGQETVELSRVRNALSIL